MRVALHFSCGVIRAKNRVYPFFSPMQHLNPQIPQKCPNLSLHLCRPERLVYASNEETTELVVVERVVWSSGTEHP